jgi:uncharacterized membrane protein affecting hemolysin expression
MYQTLLLASLLGILLTLFVVKRTKSPKRKKRWMPDIRRVV